MPEIVHACGKKLRFPEGSEGRKGKCPSCGQAVEVPRSSSAPASAAPASAAAPAPVPPAPRSDGKVRAGLAPVARPREETPRIHLEPPPGWDEYQAYLDGKGPSPRRFVMPANLMLKADAEEQWKRAEAAGPPSKFKCPGCQKTLHVGDLVCLGCGVDLRLGRTVDGSKKLSEEGVASLEKIPWLADAPPPEATGEDDEDAAEPSEAKKKLAARLKKKRRNLR